MQLQGESIPQPWEGDAPRQEQPLLPHLHLVPDGFAAEVLQLVQVISTEPAWKPEGKEPREWEWGWDPHPAQDVQLQGCRKDGAGVDAVRGIAVGCSSSHTRASFESTALGTRTRLGPPNTSRAMRFGCIPEVRVLDDGTRGVPPRRLQVQRPQQLNHRHPDPGDQGNPPPRSISPKARSWTGNHGRGK